MNSKMTNNYENVLKKLPFYPYLNQEEKQFLLNGYVIKDYKKGSNIYSATNECLGVIIVLKAYLMSEQGKEVTLYRLTENGICIMTASCLLKKITFDVYIDAVADSKVLIIKSDVFEKLKSNDIRVENFALTVASERFSDVMWAIEQMLFLPVEKRVALFLYDEYSKSKKTVLPVTQEAIASYIGSASEVVGRTLKKYEKRGIVELSNGQIKLLKISELNI